MALALNNLKRVDMPLNKKKTIKEFKVDVASSDAEEGKKNTI